MESATRLRHLPHLDALRGLAALAVFYNHMLPALPGANYFGWSGVQLFFVLSGFLITRILLAERAEAERRGTRGPALLSFYLRRALRIFPVYYLCVLTLYVLKTPGMQKHLWYHLTYTYNFRLAAYEQEVSHVRHFWSLCVEEQFYLVWPFLVLFLPRRLLRPLMVLAALAAPVSRVWLALGLHDRFWLYMQPWCSLDCLALGGLLALVEARAGTDGLLHSGYVRACKWLGGVLALGYLYLSSRATALTIPAWFGPMDVIWIVGNSCLAVCFTYVVARSCNPPPGDWQRLLSMNWLRLSGKISYGLYVYHHIIINQYHLRVPPAANPVACAEVCLGVPLSYLAATLSWYAFERPILRLKDRFTQEKIRGWFQRPTHGEHRPMIESRKAA